jgi:hypothetical protein
MAYSPKYVPVSEIPVQVPDDYNDREKNAAIEMAESSVELDLNNGDELDEEQLISMVEAAIKQKATCELVKGAEDPNSTKLGDLSDDGTTKSEYAQSFCDRYDELVMKLVGTELFDQSMDPYVYTTSSVE